MESGTDCLIESMLGTGAFVCEFPWVMKLQTTVLQTFLRVSCETVLMPAEAS